MPNRHSVKTYAENSIYHAYNRGVEKRVIFANDQDYRVFLHLLKYYLSPSDRELPHPLTRLPNYPLIRPRPLANLGNQVNLLAFCLMPNHFHLLIRQQTRDGMSKLLRRISTTYSMYFNKRYKRVGHLFQGVYKAVLVDKDEYILHLSRYIHQNPSKLTGFNLASYPYSSYAYYLGIKKASWIKPEFILSYFSTRQQDFPLENFASYKEFVEKYPTDSREILSGLTID